MSIFKLLLLLLLLLCPFAAAEEQAAPETTEPELPPALQEFLDRELESFPPVEQHYRKAQNYEARGKFAEAITELNLALKEDPKHVPSNCELGIVYMGQEKYDLAIEQLQKTLKLDPKYPKTYYALANAYARKADPDVVVARQNLDKAVELGYHPVPWFQDYLKRLEAEKGIVDKVPQTATPSTSSNK